MTISINEEWFGFLLNNAKKTFILFSMIVHSYLIHSFILNCIKNKRLSVTIFIQKSSYDAQSIHNFGGLTSFNKLDKMGEPELCRTLKADIRVEADGSSSSSSSS